MQAGQGQKVSVRRLFSAPDKFGQSEKRVGGNRRIA